MTKGESMLRKGQTLEVQSLTAEPFAKIVESLQVPILVARAADESVVYANPAAEEAFGRDREALLGRHIRRLFLDPSPYDAMLVTLARRGQASQGDTLVLRADGTSIPMAISIEPLFFEGEPAFCTTFLDRSELHRVESALRVTADIERLLSDISTRCIKLTPDEVESGLQDALDEMGRVLLADSSCVVLLDPDAGPPKARQELAWKKESLAEMDPAWKTLIDQDLAGIVGEIRSRGVLHLTSTDPQMLADTCDAVWTEDMSFSLAIIAINWDDKLQGMLCVESISPGRRWHRAVDPLKTVAQIFANLLQRRDVENHLAMEREKANKLEAVGILAGGIAHDFRNILLVIQGSASLARYTLDSPEKIKRILKEIESAGMRARDLTEQLLTFSKGGTPVKEIIELGDLIRESAKFCFRGTKVVCEPDIVDDLWPIEADAGQLNQVLNNLLINATQAMPQGGRVHLMACNVEDGRTHDPLLSGEVVWIMVRDEGDGIVQEDLDKIFDPYFTTKAEGTGLGLATTHSIVRKHDGIIQVSSKIGEGTTFSIYLPALRDAARPPTGPVEELQRGEGRILVVDDEEPVQRLTLEMLDTLGYAAVAASDGDEAIQTYIEGRERGRPFDAVLMDLTIPGGLGGTEAMARLREIAPEARVIVSSGYSHDPVMANYAQYGFVDVLPKPFPITQLGQVLRRVLHPVD